LITVKNSPYFAVNPNPCGEWDTLGRMKTIELESTIWFTDEKETTFEQRKPK
jgi:hypothetical protein